MTNRLRLFAICFVAVVALIGCGSDSDPESSPVPDSGQADTGITDTGVGETSEGDAGVDAQDDVEITPEASPDAEPEGGVTTGSLTVGFDHADGGFTISDGTQTIASKTSADCPEENDYYTCHFELQTGPYIVAYMDVAGYATPDDAIISLSEAGGSTFGNYTPATSYQLTVGVNIEEGSFTVSHLDGGGQLQVVASQDAANCPLSGDYYTCQMTLPVDGGYLVEFADVAGFTTPDSIDVDLSQADVAVQADYEPL